MLGRALTYLILYSTLGMMLRWSYGVHLLTQADEDVQPLEDTEAGDTTAAVSETTAVDDPSLPLLGDEGVVQRGPDRKRGVSPSSVGSAIREFDSTGPVACFPLVLRVTPWSLPVSRKRHAD